jgi:magnesium-transporting ATPase (P-type)
MSSLNSDNNNISLSSARHLELLSRLDTNVHTGLSIAQVTLRRQQYGNNTLTPPINCPGWICCLLPCIKHIPSMQVFRSIQPDAVEVKRNQQWMRYDASGVVLGDVIRLEEGDVVAADCTVLLVDSTEEFLVDHSKVTGERAPKSCTKDNTNNTNNTTSCQLYWGGQVLQGSAIAVVTAVGDHTLVGRLIQARRFPVQETSSASADAVLANIMGITVNHTSGDEGIALMTQRDMVV